MNDQHKSELVQSAHDALIEARAKASLNLVHTVTVGRSNAAVLVVRLSLDPRDFKPGCMVALDLLHTAMGGVPNYNRPAEPDVDDRLAACVYEALCRDADFQDERDALVTTFGGDHVAVALIRTRGAASALDAAASMAELIVSCVGRVMRTEATSGLVPALSRKRPPSTN